VWPSVGANAPQCIGWVGLRGRSIDGAMLERILSLESLLEGTDPSIRLIKWS